MFFAIKILHIPTIYHSFPTKIQIVQQKFKLFNTIQQKYKYFNTIQHYSTIIQTIQQKFIFFNKIQQFLILIFFLF